MQTRTLTLQNPYPWPGVRVWRVGVGVQLKYPRVTHDNLYGCVLHVPHDNLFHGDDHKTPFIPKVYYNSSYKHDKISINLDKSTLAPFNNHCPPSWCKLHHHLTLTLTWIMSTAVKTWWMDSVRLFKEQLKIIWQHSEPMLHDSLSHLNGKCLRMFFMSLKLGLISELS